MSTNIPIKFNIINNIKNSSIFLNHCFPVMFCSHCAKKKTIPWSYITQNVKYYKNNLSDKTCSNTNFYTLSFVTVFHSEGDYRLSYTYPYTLTHLYNYVKALQNKSEYENRIKCSELCKTLHKRVCPLLTITNFKSSEEEIKKRKIIFFTSRIHPGETPGSFIMEGIINNLVESSKNAEDLRNSFVFKVIPMLNPDGVREGYSR